jgi:hypothetical protein
MQKARLVATAIHVGSRSLAPRARRHLYSAYRSPIREHRETRTSRAGSIPPVLAAAGEIPAAGS